MLIKAEIAWSTSALLHSESSALDDLGMAIANRLVEAGSSLEDFEADTNQQLYDAIHQELGEIDRSTRWIRAHAGPGWRDGFEAMKKPCHASRRTGGLLTQLSLADPGRSCRELTRAFVAALAGVLEVSSDWEQWAFEEDSATAAAASGESGSARRITSRQRVEQYVEHLAFRKEIAETALDRGHVTARTRLLSRLAGELKRTGIETAVAPSIQLTPPPGMALAVRRQQLELAWVRCLALFDALLMMEVELLGEVGPWRQSVDDHALLIRRSMHMAGLGLGALALRVEASVERFLTGSSITVADEASRSFADEVKYEVRTLAEALETLLAVGNYPDALAEPPQAFVDAARSAEQLRLRIDRILQAVLDELEGLAQASAQQALHGAAATGEATGGDKAAWAASHRTSLLKRSPELAGQYAAIGALGPESLLAVGPDSFEIIDMVSRWHPIDSFELVYLGDQASQEAYELPSIFAS